MKKKWSKKDLKNFIIKRVKFWWDELAIHPPNACVLDIVKFPIQETPKQSVFLSARECAAVTDINVPYGSIEFSFNEDLITRSKKEIDRVVCHECVHVIMSRFSNSARRLLQAFITDEKASSLVQALLDDEEEYVCEQITNKLVRGNEPKKTN